MNQKAEVSNIAGHYLLGHIPLIGKNENWFPLIEFRGANGKKNRVWFSVRGRKKPSGRKKGGKKIAEIAIWLNSAKPLN